VFNTSGNVGNYTNRGLARRPAGSTQFFGTGHFALETHAKEIGAVIRDFFAPGV